jgi:hypothetical protein
VFVLMTNKDPVLEGFPFPHITSWPEHDLWSTVGIVDGHAGSAPTETWVPVVTHDSGVGGSVWRSNLSLLNRSTLPNLVRLRLRSGSTFAEAELTLGAGETRALEDVAGELGFTGSAPLQVFSSEPVQVSSRTINQVSGGTFGQTLDPPSPAAALDQGDLGVLMHLREDSRFRSNLGLVNTGKRAAEVRVTLYDGSGVEVGGLQRTVSPYQQVQLNRPFWTRGGRDDIASGYATVRVVEGLGVLAYASVVDNLTSDPTTIPPRTLPGSASAWVAAAAHAPGAFSSTWRTDLGVLNSSGQERSVTITVLDHGVQVGETVLAVQDGEQANLVDALGLLGVDGTGAIAVAADGPVLVRSRTYNSTETGTFGQGLEGVGPEGAASSGSTVWLTGLTENDGFRTNLGLVNVGTSSLRATIQLFDAIGTRVATWTEELAAGEQRHVNRPFLSAAGRSDIDVGSASVTVEGGDGRLLAYASVIDNRTNDPTTIPMRF